MFWNSVKSAAMVTTAAALASLVPLSLALAKPGDSDTVTVPTVRSATDAAPAPAATAAAAQAAAATAEERQQPAVKDGLSATISSDQKEYNEGEDILIDFALKNVSDTDLKIFAQESCGRYRAHTVRFVAPDGTPNDFQDVCGTCDKNYPLYRTLKPGERFAVTFRPIAKDRPDDWSKALRLDPGVYLVFGMYACAKEEKNWAGETKTEPITITIRSKRHDEQSRGTAAKTTGSGVGRGSSGEPKGAATEIEKKAAATKVSLSFADMDVAKALDTISLLGGITINKRDIPRDVTISLDVREIPVLEAIKYVTRTAGLEYTVTAGGIEVAPRKK